MFDLDRFRRAQGESHAGFTTALHELETGRKTSHWIWYIFPQLVGLGQSSSAVFYGLAGSGEAAAYLRDAVLGERLMAVTRIVRAHLADPRPLQLDELMGSRIDALKLVSCMTLFAHVARELHSAEGGPQFAAMTEDAEAILREATAQGFLRCAFTEGQLGLRSE